METTDFANLFKELLRLSPFVATLFYFLFTVWNWMQKKDDALTVATKDHQANMLQMQKESIMATNNNADAQRQLAVALVEFKGEVKEDLAEIKAGLPIRNGTRRPALVTESKSAVA